MDLSFKHNNSGGAPHLLIPEAKEHQCGCCTPVTRVVWINQLQHLHRISTKVSFQLCARMHTLPSYCDALCQYTWENPEQTHLYGAEYGFLQSCGAAFPESAHSSVTPRLAHHFLASLSFSYLRLSSHMAERTLRCHVPALEFGAIYRFLQSTVLKNCGKTSASDQATYIHDCACHAL